jgi:hypothetical protein
VERGITGRPLRALDAGVDEFGLTSLSCFILESSIG